jgi:hypothetical protein
MPNLTSKLARHSVGYRNAKIDESAMAALAIEYSITIDPRNVWGV